MPDFAQNIEVRLDASNLLGKGPPEVMVDFISYIQTPTVNVELANPVAGNV